MSTRSAAAKVTAADHSQGTGAPSSGDNRVAAPERASRESGVYEVAPRSDWATTPHAVHEKLREYVMRRLMPQRGMTGTWHQMFGDAVDGLLEREFLEEERHSVAAWARRAPACPDAFRAWMDDLRRVGPGQPQLYRWLEEHGDAPVLRRYLDHQLAVRCHLESLAGQVELGLLPEGCTLAFSAMTHWDAVQAVAGRDTLRAAVEELGGPRKPGTLECWESHSVTNLVVGLVCNQTYAFQAVGALCAVDVQTVAEGPMLLEAMSRAGVAGDVLQRYREYVATAERRLDKWHRHVLRPLSEGNPMLVTPMAEGALMLLNAQSRFLRRCRTDAVRRLAPAQARVA